MPTATTTYLCKQITSKIIHLNHIGVPQDVQVTPGRQELIDPTAQMDSRALHSVKRASF